jgi:hypothetical protein
MNVVLELYLRSWGGENKLFILSPCFYTRGDLLLERI